MMIQNIANQYLGSDLGLRIKILKNENIEKLVFFPKNDKTFIKKILFLFEKREFLLLSSNEISIQMYKLVWLGAKKNKETKNAARTSG